MLPPLFTASLLAFLFARSRTLVAASCVSYGIDFHNGGTYFQNVSSTDAFTFTSLFEGCQDDTANNILVDPNGDQYECSDTPLLPSDVNEVSTCPLDKDQLYSGEWSVLIISNNGDADPIAYERDFSLTVGVPSTVTVTPTLTVTTTSTPLVNTTTTQTYTAVTIVTTTVIVPSTTYSPTVTTTPATTTTTIIKTIAVITKTKLSVTPILITSTHTATCKIPARQKTPDPTATIKATVVTAAAQSTLAANQRFRRVPDSAVARPLEDLLKERKERLKNARALGKRSPDSSTTTVTDTNTLDWRTSTSTTTAAASTLTIATAVTRTSTSTTTTSVQSGATVLPAVTVTAATPTATVRKFTVAVVSTTVTRTQRVTVVRTVTPSAAAAVCSAEGGHMV